MGPMDPELETLNNFFCSMLNPGNLLGVTIKVGHGPYSMTSDLSTDPHFYLIGPMDPEL